MTNPYRAVALALELAERADGCKVQDLTAASGLGPKQARATLERLVLEGYLSRELGHASPRRSPGRAPMVYRRVRSNEPRPSTRTGAG